MLPPGCPAWQYRNHPDCGHLLPAATAVLLTGIQSGNYPVENSGRDTRPIHRQLFAGLEPAGHPYYVGNYRGWHKKCLRNYEVNVGDPLACAKAAVVLREISQLGEAIVRAVEAIERALESSSATIDPSQRTVAVVRVACDALVRFLTVHPYADGNGHVARALLWIILFRFGYKPDRWTIEPRPAVPTYVEMLSQHRRGKVDPLEQFVLSCISPIR